MVGGTRNGDIPGGCTIIEGILGNPCGGSMPGGKPGTPKGGIPG